jgi:hypothetical protein
MTLLQLRNSAPYHNKNGDEGMVVSLTVGTPKPDDVGMTLDQVAKGTAAESLQVFYRKLLPFCPTRECRPGLNLRQVG